MRRLLPLLIALALVAAGCGGGSAEPPEPAAREPGATATPAATPSASATAAGPAATAAAALTEAATTLRAEIRAWLADGGGEEPLPEQILSAADIHQEL